MIARKMKARAILKIDNPKRTFMDRMKAGEFDNTSEDEFSRIVDAVDFAATLWRYPNARAGELAKSEMNVLMLLANAIKVASKQNATIIRYNEGLRGIIRKN